MPSVRFELLPALWKLLLWGLIILSVSWNPMREMLHGRKILWAFSHSPIRAMKWMDEINAPQTQDCSLCLLALIRAIYCQYLNINFRAYNLCVASFTFFFEHKKFWILLVTELVILLKFSQMVFNENQDHLNSVSTHTRPPNKNWNQFSWSSFFEAKEAESIAY
jgi:hypothetical protein